MNKLILDACCSVKAMWFDKSNPNAFFIDIRKEPKGFLGYGRNECLCPDEVMDFRKMNFKNNSSKLVVFEPPHLKSLGKNSYFRNKFGCLDRETWQSDLTQGFNECIRVLEDYGVLVFKWSNNEIKFREVLNLFPIKPLFGNTSNNKATSTTKWFCFMKIPEVKK
jgi:hypothetical protein